MRIALTGNPNSGKTTMFNALTGKNEKVGNWAGVTVDKKEAPVKRIYTEGKDITAVDLPGAYSMSPFTSEESVTSEYVKNSKPDVIINIVDATNLSRSLFFTTQLLELGIPVVIALNKADINRKKETEINAGLLSEKLFCPVICTSSNTGEGLSELISAVFSVLGKVQNAPYSEGVINKADRREVREADKKRFTFVNHLVKTAEKRKILTKNRNSQDKIDKILTDSKFGIPVFAVVMFLVFWISQAGPGVWIADFMTGTLEKGQGIIAELFSDANPLLSALLVDGIIGGIIAVIGFLPLVMVMYFLIALLEDCGYMARVSVVLDPIFKRVGLSGKSVIPFIVGTGCAIPGVMASRTIKNERERRATAMLAPFMPCGAKLPVIALFSGAFFSDASWVGPLMYFMGIAIIFFGALIINKITGNSARKSYFIIELPEYKVPSLMRAVKSMLSRGWAYIVKAATIILVCNTAVQVMQSFTWRLTVAETAGESILAALAGPFSYVLLPVTGVLSWQLAAAVITGFIAKENVVGTLAVCFAGLHNLIDIEELALLEGAGAEAAGVMAISKSAALAYLIFNLFTPPCFAAIGAMNAEIKSAKWFWGGIALQLMTGFSLGFIVYQGGTLISQRCFGEGFIPGLAAVALFALILTFLAVRGERKAKEEQKNKRQRIKV